jgi:hypothetical protein
MIALELVLRPRVSARNILRGWRAFNHGVWEPSVYTAETWLRRENHISYGVRSLVNLLALLLPLLDTLSFMWPYIASLKSKHLHQHGEWSLAVCMFLPAVVTSSLLVWSMLERAMSAYLVVFSLYNSDRQVTGYSYYQRCTRHKRMAAIAASLSWLFVSVPWVTAGFMLVWRVRGAGAYSYPYLRSVFLHDTASWNLLRAVALVKFLLSYLAGPAIGWVLQSLTAYGVYTAYTMDPCRECKSIKLAGGRQCSKNDAPSQ